jgi:hypothetical protein
MRSLLATLLGVVLLASGCTAAFDNDGEARNGGPLAAPAPKRPDATPVVVDSDLAPDDLAAIAYLLRHPAVRVVGITVPTTGMVTCPGGLRLLADLFTALDAPSVPVACGAEPRGPHAVPFPADWGRGVLADSGLPHLAPQDLVPVREPASAWLARQAATVDGLHVVALAPLTEVAALRREHPAAYRRIAGITSMAGVVDDDAQDPGQGVGEWNAAADPAAFAAVLAGPVPVTVVPDDPVPPGPPRGMDAPVVGGLGVGTAVESPAYWDLATAGVFTTPAAAREAASGGWTADVTSDRGRLHRAGDGSVRVVTALDTDRLDTAYAAVFEPR